jgi:hypothetical protein
MEYDFQSLYGTKYLSAGDVVARGGKLRATIAKIGFDELGQDSNHVKAILYFDGLHKGLVLNKTNAGVLRDALGEKWADWVDAVVGLYVEQVTYGGKRVPGVRLKCIS